MSVKQMPNDKDEEMAAQMPGMVLCDKCGHQLRETWKFCINCGLPLSVMTPKQPSHERFIDCLQKLQAHLEQCKEPECHLRVLLG